MGDGTEPQVRCGDDGPIEGWTRAIRDLAREAGVEGVSSELTAIGMHAARPVVRVAVVAEQSRLRATAVNQLLGGRMLPEQLADGAAVLVTAAAQESLERETAGVWLACPGGVSGPWSTGGEAPASAFRVRLRSEALAALGVEVLASPQNGGTAGPDRWPLASADAVVVAVQATAAMTMSETAFIQGLLSRIDVEQVSVLLTRLDLVEEDERADVLGHVRKRAAAISAGLTVLLEAGEERQSETAGTAVRTWLSGSVLPGCRQARTRQVARRLAACLDEVGAVARAALQAAEAEARRRREAAKKAEHVRRDELQVFDELRVELQAKRNTVLAEFRTRREEFRLELSRTLLFEAGRASDPKEWWEEELPYRLDARLGTWRELMRQNLDETVRTQVDELNRLLAEGFGVRPIVPAVPVERRAGPAAPGELPTPDLRSRRLLYRMGPAGVAALGMLLLPAVAPLAGLTGSLVATGLGEIRLRTLVGEQQELIRRRLPSLIDKVLDAQAVEIGGRLEETYRYIEAEVLGHRRAHSLRRAGSAAAAAESGEPDWASIRDRAEDLSERVLAGVPVDVDYEREGARE